jgi:hypothetical protein
MKGVIRQPTDRAKKAKVEKPRPKPRLVGTSVRRGRKSSLDGIDLRGKKPSGDKGSRTGDAPEGKTGDRGSVGRRPGTILDGVNLHQARRSADRKAQPSSAGKPEWVDALRDTARRRATRPTKGRGVLRWSDDPNAPDGAAREDPSKPFNTLADKLRSEAKRDSRGAIAPRKHVIVELQTTLAGSGHDEGAAGTKASAERGTGPSSKELGRTSPKRAAAPKAARPTKGPQDSGRKVKGYGQRRVTGDGARPVRREPFSGDRDFGKEITKSFTDRQKLEDRWGGQREEFLEQRGAREQGRLSAKLKESYQVGIEGAKSRTLSRHRIKVDKWDNPFKHAEIGETGRGIDDIGTRRDGSKVILEWKGEGGRKGPGQLGNSWLGRKLAELKAVNDPMADKLLSQLRKGRLTSRVYTTKIGQDGKPDTEGTSIRTYKGNAIPKVLQAYSARAKQLRENPAELQKVLRGVPPAWRKPTASQASQGASKATESYRGTSGKEVRRPIRTGGGEGPPEATQPKRQSGGQPEGQPAAGRRGSRPKSVTLDAAPKAKFRSGLMEPMIADFLHAAMGWDVEAREQSGAFRMTREQLKELAKIRSEKSYQRFLNVTADALTRNGQPTTPKEVDKLFRSTVKETRTRETRISPAPPRNQTRMKVW